MGVMPQHMDGDRAPSSDQPLVWWRGVMARAVRAATRVLLEAAGWLLLVGGLAAIPLPGPGLLITLAGLVLLSRRHAWAKRRVEAVRLRALHEAAKNVATKGRLVVSVVGAILVAVSGMVWIVSPRAPGWWPLTERWWLPGGVAVGVTQVASAVVALGLLAYSYRRFHGSPEASSRAGCSHALRRSGPRLG